MVQIKIWWEVGSAEKRLTWPRRAGGDQQGQKDLGGVGDLMPPMVATCFAYVGRSQNKILYLPTSYRYTVYSGAHAPVALDF